MRKTIVHIVYFTHATTKDNEKRVASGWADAELSERGRRECVEMRKLVAKIKFDVVFCSDLSRAVDSAKLVFRDSAAIVEDRRLREVNFGDFTRMPSKVIDSVMFEHISKPFPNGESCRDVENRVRSFLDDLVRDYRNKMVAIVSHRVPQLALEALINRKSWNQAVDEDWRIKKPSEWKPGWKYELEE